MKSFLPKVASMVEGWSRRSQELGFATVPDISRQLWEDGYKLSRSADFKVVPLGPATDLRLVRDFSHGEPQIQIRPFVRMYFDPARVMTSFEDYSKFLSSWYIVKKAPAGYLTCSCEASLKAYRCVHSLAVEIRDKLVEVPEYLTSEPLGNAKKGPGRPRKVRGGYGQGDDSKKPKK